MQGLRLAAPADFQFRSTVLSHGWCVLHPFGYDEASGQVTRIQRLGDGSLVHLTLGSSEPPGEIVVLVDGLNAPLTPEQCADVEAAVERILGFDQRVEAFHEVARTLPGYDWVERAGAGRMLVSPTVWEDLAKTLLTTNTTWRMTKDMVARLVTLGDADAQGRHSFPTPEQVAALGPEALNAHVRAGYRGAYLHALALDISEARLDPEHWRDPTLKGADVYRELLALQGFGPYAAGAMMRLVGNSTSWGWTASAGRPFARSGITASRQPIARSPRFTRRSVVGAASPSGWTSCVMRS